jgi:hypothetical protein
MHAVSLTPHAQKHFLTTSKSENHMQNSGWYAKKIQIHALSLKNENHMQHSDGMQKKLKIHARSTNDSNGPGSL